MAIKDIADLAEYMREAQSAFKRAATKAQIQTLLAAKAQAIKNAKQQFIGRWGRRLSGALFNSIYEEFNQEGDKIPVGFLGVRNIPYGAIHEFGSRGLPGGVIKPVKAQKLWIPNYQALRNKKLTPREFVRMKRSQRGYYISGKSAGQVIGTGERRRNIPFFFLRESVKIPARPYLTPAIEQELKRFQERFSRWLEKEVK